MGGLVVKPRSRVFHGHEWIYQTEIQKVFGDPEAGAVVSLKDFKDRSLGSAIYNPQSMIVARRFSRRKQELDQPFFERRLRRAREYRETLGLVEDPLTRLVWSESDGLPGVVLDRYGDHLVLQILTLGMELRLAELVAAIRQEFEPASLTLRNDASGRQAEGLLEEKRVLWGEPPVGHMKTLAGVTLFIDAMEGQKTGLYLDQLDNYEAVAALARERKVLDCFCNQGGFALYAAQAGAREVLGVDISERAIEMARDNAKQDGVEIEFQTANVFDFLKQAERDGASYDLIILDPPSFTRSKKTLQQALRGYKEIHLRALKMLQPGGLLATFCCSHHVAWESFSAMIGEAAVDAKKTVRLRARHRQREDHPVLLNLPESEYLHGATYEVIASW